MGQHLLIDIGNSAIKLASSSGANAILKTKSFPYRKSLFKEDLLHIVNTYIKDAGKFEKAGVSSVHNKNNAINFVIKKTTGSAPLLISSKVKLPIKIEYKTSLGSDRICSSSAAYSIYNKKQILVVDFGTATTYNLVIDGIFKGGIIAPGIKTSMDSLLANSSLPEPQNIKINEELIADNTEDAIINGAVYPALFTSAKIIAELKGRYKKLFTVFTGGFSEMIGSKSKSVNEIDKNLVLKGVNIISGLNEN